MVLEYHAGRTFLLQARDFRPCGEKCWSYGEVCQSFQRVALMFGVHSIRLPSGNTAITFSLSVTVFGGNESLKVS